MSQRQGPRRGVYKYTMQIDNSDHQLIPIWWMPGSRRWYRSADPVTRTLQQIQRIAKAEKSAWVLATNPNRSKCLWIVLNIFINIRPCSMTNRWPNGQRKYSEKSCQPKNSFKNDCIVLNSQTRNEASTEDEVSVRMAVISLMNGGMPPPGYSFDAQLKKSPAYCGKRVNEAGQVYERIQLWPLPGIYIRGIGKPRKRWHGGRMQNIYEPADRDCRFMAWTVPQCWIYLEFICSETAENHGLTA